MSENFCPVCGESLAVESINITEGVALCPACGRLSRLSEVVTHKRPLVEILANPPRGCSIAQHGRQIEVKVSLRSLGGFIAMLFITLFWNGVVSVFVLAAIAGLYANLVGPLPQWFPKPDDNMGLGMTLFLCVFLIPFVLVGLVLLLGLVMTIMGRVVVVIGEHEAYAASGIGILMWRRWFDPQQVRQIETPTLGRADKKDTDEESPGKKIVIHADRVVRFGSAMPEERREWLVAVLRELLINPDPQRQRELVLMASGGWRNFGEE